MSRIEEYSRAGLTFDVIDSGPLDGAPVVLLHGFPERAASWSRVSERLHAAGLRTYAPDQRGYSPRARPRSRFGYRVPELTKDVTALIEEIGQPVHLVGHDWGAAIAWSVAGRHPELVRTFTAVSVQHPVAFVRAVLTSTQLFKSYYMLLFQIPWLPVRALSDPGMARKFLRGAGMTSDEVAAYQQGIVGYGALKPALGWYRSLPLTDLRKLKKVTVPTTYIWSDNDIALVRKGAELCAEYVTGPYRFEIFHGASHWLPTQESDRVADLIIARAADQLPAVPADR